MVKYEFMQTSEIHGMVTKHFAGGSYGEVFSGHWMEALIEYRELLSASKANKNFTVFELGEV